MGINSKGGLRPTVRSYRGHVQASSATRRRTLDASSLILLTLGGVMGSGLFLASAQAMRLAGPGVVVAYLVGALAMGLEVALLAEMAAATPARGSFLTYARRAIGPAPAFVGGWIFWLSSVLNLAAEATAAATFLRLWLPGAPLWVFSVGLSLLVAASNFLPLAGFDRVESAMSAAKLVTLVLFALASGLALAGVLGHRPIPGVAALHPFFPHGFSGVAAAMTVVMFSMAGTGVLGLAAVSVRHPESAIPRSVLPSVLTVAGFYVLSALAITVLTPLSSLSASGPSPFVQAVGRLNIPWAASVLNAVLVLAVLSAMNAGLFATDRVLASLARFGAAPSSLAARQARRPLAANAVTGAALILASGLSYLLPKTAFLLLVTATSYQAIFIWILVVVTEIPYRRWLERKRPWRLRFRVPLHPYTAMGEVALLLAVLATAPLVPHQLASLAVAVGVTGLGAAAYASRRAVRRAARS